MKKDNSAVIRIVFLCILITPSPLRQLVPPPRHWASAENSATLAIVPSERRMAAYLWRSHISRSSACGACNHEIQICRAIHRICEAASGKNIKCALGAEVIPAEERRAGRERWQPLHSPDHSPGLICVRPPPLPPIVSACLLIISLRCLRANFSRRHISNKAACSWRRRPI